MLDADHRNAQVLDDAALADLARQVRGELIRAGDPLYEAARRVWNGAVDRRPVLVARCTGVADVRAAVCGSPASGSSWWPCAAAATTWPAQRRAMAES